MSKTTKLTAAERARRYREKIKLDKARNEVYKKKKKESNEKRMKRGDMPKKMLQRERAKNREYIRAMKLKKVAERQMTDTLSSTITQAHGLPEFKSNENEELPAIPTKFNENTSENKRLKRNISRFFANCKFFPLSEHFYLSPNFIEMELDRFTL